MSMKRLAAGQKGTRVEPPKPLSVLVKAAPVKGLPLTKIVVVWGWVLAPVKMLDSCQPLTTYLENLSVFLVKVGVKMAVPTKRCR